MVSIESVAPNQKLLIVLWPNLVPFEATSLKPSAKIKLRDIFSTTSRRYANLLWVETFSGWGFPWFSHMACLFSSNWATHSGGRRLSRRFEIRSLLADEFHHTKGPGARKILCSLKDNFVGQSKPLVQDILNHDKLYYHRNAKFPNKALYYHRNAKFLNKAPLKPIQAHSIQLRHQIDLTDLGKQGSVSSKGAKYRYVLSVLDVFSTFVWLRPLEKKTSRSVANELRNIYLEHGPPLVIQSDQGSEFKDSVKRLPQNER